MSGAFKLNSRPNTGQLQLRYPRTTTNKFLWPQESHGPYTAFMGSSVSGDVMPRGGPGVWSPDGSTTRPTASPAYTGPAYEGWYKSEFGCTVWPSFESISAQLPKDQWSMSSAAAAKRNWNVANVIGPFFGTNATAAMRDSGEQAFKRQLYQSMISQVLYLKTQIESRRSQNIWGNTFWCAYICRCPLHHGATIFLHFLILPLLTPFDCVGTWNYCSNANHLRHRRMCE